MRLYFNLLTAFKTFFTANRNKWGNFSTELFTHESKTFMKLSHKRFYKKATNG